MRGRRWMSAGVVGAAILIAGCSKSEPGETTPEQAAGAKADTAAAQAGAAVDTAATAAGAYGDTTAAAAGAAQDSARAAGAAADSTMGAAADTAAVVLPDTSGMGARVDSVQRDSM
jgi:hypothetical protein